MKNKELISDKAKANNSVNNDVLSPETIKAQLKAACQDMTAKETKEYITSLHGYDIRLTGQKPTQHYTVFFGNIRICNVEQVQGIKADGTARGCVSVVKANLTDRITTAISKFATLTVNLTKDERMRYDELTNNALQYIDSMQTLLDTANSRAAERAAEAAKAAKAKREAAAKERATKKVGAKIAAGTDSEKIAAIAAALNVSYDVAATIYQEQKQTA